MHPARLRIHPARPGSGSRAPGSWPSGRPALRLPGRPGGDTGGRAPCLPRSFHFESTLRKFAKLVSRWLLLASQESAAHQPALAAAPGGSRWLPRGFGRAAWEARRARSGAGAAPPERAGSHRAAQTPAAGCCLGGALARAPSARALPAPGPAQPRPWPRRVLFVPGGQGGSRPGGARLEDRYGDAGAQRRRRWGPVPLPSGLPTRLPGRRGRAGKGGAGDPGRPLPVGRWLCSSWPGEAQSPRTPPLENGSAETAVPPLLGLLPEGERD